MRKDNIIIQLDKISKYAEVDSKTCIVADVSLKVYSKDVVFLIGKSGSGKTTILEIISGFQRPTEGYVYIREKVSNDVSTYDRKVVFVDHNATLFDYMSVYENIMFGFREDSQLSLEEKDKKIRYNAKKLDILCLLDRYPIHISGGQKQLVAICRSTLENNRIVLMDEPFGKIDNLSKINVYNHIQEYRQKSDSAFVIITHDMEDVKMLSTKILFVYNKKIVEYESIEQMQNTHNRSVIEFTNNYSYIKFDDIKITKEEVLLYKYGTEYLISKKYVELVKDDAIKDDIMLYINKTLKLKEISEFSLRPRTDKDIIHNVYTIKLISHVNLIYTYNVHLNKDIQFEVVSLYKIDSEYVKISSIINKLIVFY